MVHNKKKKRTTIWANNSTCGYSSKKNEDTILKIHIHSLHSRPTFTAALSVTAKMWEQPMCPSWNKGHRNCDTHTHSKIPDPKKNTIKNMIWHRQTSPPGQKVSNMLPGKSGGQLLTAPERMKRLGQSGNDTQLSVCLVMKVKSDAVKNSTAWEHGM